MGIEKIVDVQISRETSGVTQAGFGTSLILGPNGFNGEVRSYSSLSAVAEDYETSDAEYVEASKVFAQTPRPPLVKIGKTSTPVAQIVTFTPDVTLQEIQDFTVTIDGIDYTFSSDSDPTDAEIVTGLIALINADTNAKVTASGTTTLIITADGAGRPFTYSSSVNLPGVLTTASNGIDNDIQDAIDVDNDWYFLLTTAKDAVTVEVAAATIEALRKLYVFLINDSDVLTNVTTDLVSLLKAKNYFRTAAFFTETPADYHQAAFVGRVSPLSPGSETWANKTLAAVTVDKFTDGELVNLDFKNANYYITIGGVNITQNGKVVGGEYIDVIRFIDWVQARMQETVLSTIVSSDKVPYTDGGITLVEKDLRAVLEEGVRAGGIASSQDYTVTVPKASSISKNQKATRKLVGVKFTAVLAGAIHAVEIQGTVTL